MLYIESLEIDDHILDKIEAKHSIAFGEVEEACLSDKRHVRRSREGLYKLFSQTAAGRYILVVLVIYSQQYLILDLFFYLRNNVDFL